MPPAEMLHSTEADDGQQSSYIVDVLGKPIEIASPLRGAHQHRNVALAIAAAVELAISHGFPITPKSIAEGIRNTRWPARLELIEIEDSATHRKTEFILDVAHNPAGSWALRAGLHDLLPRQQLGTLIFSCLRDKPVVEMAQILFPLFDQVIFAPIQSVRATPMRDLLAAAASTGTPAFAATSVNQAIELALEHASVPVLGEGLSRAIKAGHANSSATHAIQTASPIVVSGSVYLVGDVRTRLLAKGAQAAPPRQAAERVGQLP
jgi:dihydrofolate synthase/folylpolyglutamate synthase